MKVESQKSIKGFSKLSKEAKIEWVVNNYTNNPELSTSLLKSYWHEELSIQKLHDEFIENTLTNYYLPFAVAPNFNINGKMYCIPLAIEESSVVAAAAKAANYWLGRGGFKTSVISTTKIGQVHFIWKGSDKTKLSEFFNQIKPKLYSQTESLTQNMRKRGGGILSIDLRDKTDAMEHYYQIHATFDTRDSMGANFINSVLEEFAKVLRSEIQLQPWSDIEKEIQVVMCILSNYTPDCRVRAEVSCPIQDLDGDILSPEEFAYKFQRAVRIAEVEPYRAVTHNKGIMNGIDSVVIATGNDFRAIEACAHAYAARNGQYASLTHCNIENGQFVFYLEIPLSLGTVGGITSLHPMVKFAHDILGHPGAEELMQITAAVGLAQNFSAVRSLTTTGIQKGHMKMHLLNILNQLGACEDEKAKVIEYFKDKVVSYNAAVAAFNKFKS
ncbi:MAG: hydroxymethylglutaryl-CoA reductase, degradative [Bacteroidia bacterium]|nr:hydroxymethylglutaryl-CoA reductase, degradative [Bacteroidia bacterium]